MTADSEQQRSPLFYVISALVFVALAALLWLLGSRIIRGTAPPVAGEIAPDFALTDFETGEIHTLESLEGKIIVLNFWASWCVPCATEAPELEAIQQAYADRDVVVLGVDYADTETEALAFLEKYEITYINGPDLGTRISQAYRIKGVPETYVIAPDGTLAETIIGPATSAHLSGILDDLLP